MQTALLVAVVIAAGAACPLMGWIQRRRGRAAGCCAMPRKETDELARLRAERERVVEQIAACERAEETSR